MIKHILKWEPAKVKRGFVKNIYQCDSNVLIILNDYFKNEVLNGNDISEIFITCEDSNGNTLFRSSKTYFNADNDIEVMIPIKEMDNLNLIDGNYPIMIHIANNKYKLQLENEIELPVIFNMLTKSYFEFYITKSKYLRIKKIKREESVSINNIKINHNGFHFSLTLFLPILYKLIKENPNNFSLEIKLLSGYKVKTVAINMGEIKFSSNFTAVFSTEIQVKKLDMNHTLTFSIRNNLNNHPIYETLTIIPEQNAIFKNKYIILEDEVFIVNSVNTKNNQYELRINKKLFEPRVQWIEKISSDSFKIVIEFAGEKKQLYEDIGETAKLMFKERQTKATMIYDANYNKLNKTIEIILDKDRTLQNFYFSTGVWDAFLKFGNQAFPIANPRKHRISNFSAYNYPQIIINDHKDHYSLKLYYNFNGYLSLFVRDYVIFKNVQSISFCQKKLNIYGHVNIMKPNNGLSGNYEGEIQIPIPFKEPIILKVNIHLEKTELNDIEYAFSIESLEHVEKDLMDKIILAKNYNNWLVSSTNNEFKYQFSIVINKDLEISNGRKIINDSIKLKVEKIFDKLKIPVYKLLTKILPIKKNSYIFQSFYGNSYACNPRAIYEKLYDLEGDKNKYIWVLKDKKLFTGKKAIIVKPKSWKYFYYMARAQFFINNANFPDFFVKRDKTYFLQTWHGTPLKKLGLDVPENTQAFSANSDKKLLERTKKWDILISPNEYTSEIMKRAYQLEIPIKTIGYPRNDQLVQVDYERITKIKEYFNIPKDKKVILYAPTWREDDDKKESYRLKFNIKKFYHALNGEYVFLLRLHYFDARRLQLKEFSDFIINATYYNDIADLYNIADILVTDYSSVMFDYSITKRPILFYAYDYSKYKEKLRGFYLDFKSIAPGPILKDSDELLYAIKHIDEVNRKYKNKYEQFRNKFNSYENGNASLEVIKILTRVKEGEKIV